MTRFHHGICKTSNLAMKAHGMKTHMIFDKPNSLQHAKLELNKTEKKQHDKVHSLGKRL